MRAFVSFSLIAALTGQMACAPVDSSLQAQSTDPFGQNLVAISRAESADDILRLTCAYYSQDAMCFSRVQPRIAELEQEVREILDDTGPITSDAIAERFCHQALKNEDDSAHCQPRDSQIILKLAAIDNKAFEQSHEANYALSESPLNTSVKGDLAVALPAVAVGAVAIWLGVKYLETLAPKYHENTKKEAERRFKERTGGVF